MDTNDFRRIISRFPLSICIHYVAILHFVKERQNSYPSPVHLLMCTLLSYINFKLPNKQEKKGNPLTKKGEDIKSKTLLYQWNKFLGRFQAFFIYLATQLRIQKSSGHSIGTYYMFKINNQSDHFFFLVKNEFNLSEWCENMLFANYTTVYTVYRYSL